MTLVSVIIPTYNRSALLKEAVLSVFQQTYRPIECIVVDDGSTDESACMMSELNTIQVADFRLKYIVQANSGSQVARNTGIKHATGAFIQFLDSDDLLYPDKLSKQVSHLNTCSDCDAVFGDWEKGEQGKAEMIHGYTSNDMVLQLLTQQPIHTLSILFRRNIVEQIGDWDVCIKRNQEIDYHLRGLLAGAVYHYLPGVTGLWRTHEGERIFSKTNFASAITFYRKWEQLLKERKIWTEKFQQGFVRNYMWFLGTYPQSSTAEIMKLLKEVYRLQPEHPIFRSFKFRLFKLAAGFSVALRIWIKQYQKNSRK